MSYSEALELPLKTFWLLSGNIDRIMAQKDVRHMSVVSMSQATEEAVNNFRQRLTIETGTVVKIGEENPMEAERDEVGFAELKAMSGTF